MAAPENRFSTTVVSDEFLDPDGRFRTLNEDYEAGPIALNDPSAGLYYQPWRLTWSNVTNFFTVTPEITGTPQSVLTAADVKYCSFAFDQNGHVNIAYQQENDTTWLYWYDTVGDAWVTDQLDAGTWVPTLLLDDKRQTQTQANDVQLFYTRQQPNLSWNLYMRQQRDRYLIEYEMATAVLPYIHKSGMHRGLRVQLALKAGPY